MLYLTRCAEGTSILGLAMGEREIAQRHPKIPGSTAEAAWAIEVVPADWSVSNIEMVLAEAGFANLTVVGRPLAGRHGTIWRFRATTDVDKDFINIEVGDAILVARRVMAQLKARSSVQIKTRPRVYAAGAKHNGEEDDAGDAKMKGCQGQDDDFGDDDDSDLRVDADKDDTNAQDKTPDAREAVATKRGSEAQAPETTVAKRYKEELDRWTRGLTLRETDRDGNCLYHAMANAMLHY